MKNLLAFSLLCMIAVCAFSEDEILFQQDFESIEMGSAPNDFLILEGDFAVQELDGNKVLYLPGTPLSDYGALFGTSASDGLQIQAQIKSENQKRLFPRIGVGLCGVNGYKLYIVPSKRMLELSLNKETVVEIPFKWISNEWSSFRLQIRKVDEQWIVEGKAWQGEEEPKEWMIVHQTAVQPASGKSSVWGTPYSSQPIYFDNIVITPSS